MTKSTTELLDRITEGVGGRSDDAGIRIVATYEPVAGADSLVFPPTYPAPANEPDAGKYAISLRHIDGEVHKVVLLDSFASQANRVEETFQDAIDDGVLALPYVETAATVDEHPVRVTNLSAPHRGPDAYFRDSEAEDGTAFDETEVGRELRLADARNARPFFRYTPTDLVFGFWDSQRGGRGVKLARAYTSEIIGVDPEVGRRGAVRFDPNNITRVAIAYPDKHPEGFVVLDVDDEGKTAKPPKGMREKKPSEAGHGNVPAKDANPGVSVTSISRAAFLSLTALSRLRFPDGDGARSVEVDRAGRAVLACLGLLGDRLAFGRASLFLRSGCDLATVGTEMQWVGVGGAGDPLDLSVDDAHALLAASVERASSVGLQWAPEPVRLRPKENLLKLLAASFASVGEEE
jgi:CRISPR-associated protein Csb1